MAAAGSCAPTGEKGVRTASLPPATAVFVAAGLCELLRWIRCSELLAPRLKSGWPKTQASGSTLLKPYVFSWRTNDEKLLCLKYSGSSCCANASG
jgi:hypothetical protein